MEAVDPRWRKASYSGNGGGNCVEVGQGRDGMILVRDTKDRSGSVLLFTADEWADFTAKVTNKDSRLRTRMGVGRRGWPLTIRHSGHRRLFSDAQTPRIHVVLDESVICGKSAGPGVTRQQIVAEDTSRPAVNTPMIPASSGARLTAATPVTIVWKSPRLWPRRSAGLDSYST